jgi:hypothetical protein
MPDFDVPTGDAQAVRGAAAQIRELAGMLTGYHHAVVGERRGMDLAWTSDLAAPAAKRETDGLAGVLDDYAGRLGAAAAAFDAFAGALDSAVTTAGGLNHQAGDAHTAASQARAQVPHQVTPEDRQQAYDNALTERLGPLQRQYTTAMDGLAQAGRTCRQALERLVPGLQPGASPDQISDAAYRAAAVGLPSAKAQYEKDHPAKIDTEWRGPDRRDGRRGDRDRATREPEGGRGRDRRDGPLDDLDSDWAGRTILEHYLYGGGKTLTIENDPTWSKYMMDNQSLRDHLLGAGTDDDGNPYPQRIQNAAFNAYSVYRQHGQTNGVVDSRFHMDIENGEGMVGYQYLHGTNADTGDFRLQGTTDVRPTADGGAEVHLHNTYTWNDRIDPNPKYTTDKIKDFVAGIVSLGQKKPYDIHVTWTADTVVKIDKDGHVVSTTGYPGN